MNAPAAGGSSAQLTRLLTLVPWLHAKGEVDVKEAAARLGVKPAQLQRDLTVLWMCGLPGGLPDDLIDVDMDAIKDDGVIRVSNADYLARPMRLDPVEASALIVALRTLRDGSEADTSAVLDRTLAKLEAAAEDGAQGADQVDVRLMPGEKEAAVLTQQLTAAIDADRQVELDYWVPSRDEATNRVVDPLRLRTEEQYTYLDAWCHAADAARLFRLDRINAATTLDTPRAHHEPNGEQLAEGVFHPGEDATSVTLEVDRPAAWIAEYYPVDTVTDAQDPARPGALRVDLKVSDPRWLTRLLMRLAPHARVVAPQEFTDSFHEAARRTLGLYTGKGVR